MEAATVIIVSREEVSGIRHEFFFVNPWFLVAFAAKSFCHSGNKDDQSQFKLIVFMSDSC